MRISTKQYYDVAEQSMTRSAEGAYSWQRKLASGQRIDRASDDPAAAGRAVILNARLSRIDMFKANQDFAKANLSDMDTALDGMQSQLMIIQEASVQAANGSLNSEAYSALSAKLEQAIDELKKNASQKDSAGRPLFDNADSAELEIQPGLTVNILLARSQVFGGGAGLDDSDLMNAVNGVANAISAGRPPTAVELSDLATAREKLTRARANVGLDSGAADSSRDAIEAYELGTIQQKSELLDTDLAQGVSEFVRNQTLLETARSLFSRISSTGLFGMLK